LHPFLIPIPIPIKKPFFPLYKKKVGAQSMMQRDVNTPIPSPATEIDTQHIFIISIIGTICLIAIIIFAISYKNHLGYIEARERNIRVNTIIK
jgi:hypothetical protein